MFQVIRRKILPAAVIAGLAFCTPAIVRADEPTAQAPTSQELLEQIKQLQEKVQQLETQQQVQQQQQLNSRDVDATVEAVIRDADRRSQLMQAEGFTAGWSKGKFLIQSADGNFVMNPNFQLQVRHNTTVRDDIAFDDGDPIDGDDDDIESGFEIRRLKFGVKGNLYTPKLQYDLVWATNREGGQLVLEDAIVQWWFRENWAVFGGQYKDPVHHEELTSSKRQLAVDRSFVNEVLGGGETDRVQGVGLRYGGEESRFKAMVTFTDGIDTDNSNFEDSTGSGSAIFGVPDPNFGTGGRIEYALIGAPKDAYKYYEDFTAMANKTDMLVLGAGGDWTQDGGNDVYFYTVDAQFENSRGLGLYGAFLGVCTASSDDDTSDTSSWGFLVQAGQMLNQKWEVFARYDYTAMDDSLISTGQSDDISEITIGVNRYVYGHNAKFTLDVFYLPDGSPFDLDGIGILEQGNDADQWGVRIQFQLLI